jgi:4-amino-4-deoxy-L-arabinose transferase-like glycosyltransferase
VFALLKKNRVIFAAGILAALCLRLFFISKFKLIDGDSLVYGDIAKNWLMHGIFGVTSDTGIDPTYIRLPGYPGFLSAIWGVFGVEHYNAVLIAQVIVDLASCFVVADLARRTVSDRAAKIAFWLTALCPFIAVYTAAPLSETLAVFFAAMALDFAVAGLDDLALGRMRNWIGCGFALAGGILLRPDGGILLGAIGLYLIYRLIVPNRPSEAQPTEGRSRIRAHAMLAGIVVATVSLSVLIPWAIRNWREFHEFQPLAPRYANAPGEAVNYGFQRWTKTWMGDYISVVEVYWCLPGEKIDTDLLPSRAFDSPEERAQTEQIFAEYNDGLDWTPEMDERLGKIADARIRRAPLHYYAVLPALRIADMWFRPRTDLLRTNDRWWEYEDDPRGTFWASVVAVINLFFVGAALWAIVRRRSVRWAGLLILFVVVRSGFLGTLENPETRYTLECYPVVIVFAAAALAGKKKRPLPHMEQTSAHLIPAAGNERS